MNNKNKNDGNKSLSKRRSSDKRNKQSSKHDEDFNTGSHSPSSLRKVGPGYDDTGMGNESQVAGTSTKVQRPKKMIKGNIQRIRNIIKRSGKSGS